MRKYTIGLFFVFMILLFAKKGFAQLEAMPNTVPTHLRITEPTELLLQKAGFNYDPSNQEGMKAFLKRKEYIHDSLHYVDQIKELKTKAKKYQHYQKEMRVYRERALSYVVRRFLEMKQDAIPGVYEKIRYEGNHAISGKSFWIEKNGVELVRLINFDNTSFENVAQHFEGKKLYTMAAYFTYHKEFAQRYTGSYLISTGEIRPLERTSFGNKYYAPFEKDIMLALVLIQDLIAQDLPLEDEIIQKNITEKLSRGDDYLIALCENNFQINWD